MKIVTIVGARPQFIKAAPVSRILRQNHTEILVHTGQHYDYKMSEIFFDDLKIPKPNYNLQVGSGSHGKQTGEMLQKIEEVLLIEKPDSILVYGDTNSTLAGGLAASKLHIPVIHIEAGLRSFNRRMPEEINRVVVDHLSTILFAPTETAVKNLQKEGITHNIYNVGDVMYDATLYNLGLAEKKSTILKQYNLEPFQYYLSTIHRPENVDNKESLANILQALSLLDKTVLLPLHPRTEKQISLFGLKDQANTNILIIPPVGYLDMLTLENNAKGILTDSGGIQKEAYFLKTPCFTMRSETEWIETVEMGWNKVVGNAKEAIIEAVSSFQKPDNYVNCYGDGKASIYMEKILSE